MRVVKIVFFFLLFGVAGLKAQTNFVKGYYITTAQDTVRGYVEYRSDERNFKHCVFKDDLTSKSQEFGPGDIKGFVFEDKDFYERHAFKNKKGEELYGFFKVILRSKLSLLRFKSRFFVEDQTLAIHEISKREEVVDGNIRKDYTGLGMLKAIMKECLHATDDIMKKGQVGEARYKDAFKKYYTCAGITFIESQTVVIKPKAEIGFQGGAALTNIRLNQLTDVTVDGDVAYSVGAYTSIFLPKIDESLRLMIEASYLNYNNYTYYQSVNTNNDLYIRYSAIRLPVLMRYSLGAVFFEAGFQSQYVVSENFKWRIESVSSGTVNTNYGEVGAIEKFSIGLLAGIGVQYKVANHAVRTFVRYSNLHTPNQYEYTRFKSLELLLSIQLNH